MNIHKNARTCPASRALLVHRVRQEGWSVEESAEALGISERRAYEWLRRAKAEGKSGLYDRSSRPANSPTRISLATQQRIIALRKEGLTVQKIAGQLRPSSATVARTLGKAGLSRLKDLNPQEPVRRYEYPNPGGLLHLDIKRLGRIARLGKRFGGRRGSLQVGWEYVHIAIDDHSRVAYVEVLRDKKAVSAVGFLKRAIAWFKELGVAIQRVMTDNGSCYIAHAFRNYCKEQGLKHIRIKPYRPQTNGKAERFVQTICREWAYARPYSSSRQRTSALPKWLHRYNHKRPHASLGGSPPMSRLEVSA